MSEQQRKENLVWRIIRYWLVRLILGFGLIFVLGLVLQRLIDSFLNPDTAIGAILTGALALSAIFLTYSIFVRILEKRPVTELSKKGFVSQVSVGMLVGTVPIAAVVGILWIRGFLPGSDQANF